MLGEVSVTDSSFLDSFARVAENESFHTNATEKRVNTLLVIIKYDDRKALICVALMKTLLRI